MVTALKLACAVCGAEYPLDTRAWTCSRALPNGHGVCGGLFEIQGAPEFDPARIDSSNSSLWRYRALLPLPPNAQPITLGEGWTPLIELDWRGKTIYCKLDFMMPTGSFKDRGSTVLVSAIKALGITNVVEDSSGNAAASLAAYCARGGLAATIFAPAHASPMKLAQIQVYGAQLQPIAGPRARSAEAAQQAVIHDGAYYASHYYNPFARSGMYTTAWELWEQLGRRAPDNLIMPVGHGTNLAGAYRGLVALRQRGLIPQLPRLFAVQAAQIAPLVEAFARGASEPAPVEPFQTLAEGIAICHPAHGGELLRALRETGGAAVGVDEDEIRAARANLARRGLFVEPTSATVFAALEKIGDRLGKNEITVVSLTGSGLKAP